MCCCTSAYNCPIIIPVSKKINNKLIKSYLTYFVNVDGGQNRPHFAE
jgi:hypothetical protein